MTELVFRMNTIEALYHAARRYEQDKEFQRGVDNPYWVAAQLRENAERIERMHAERLDR